MKTPNQKWQTIYHIGRVLSESVGMTVYTTMEIHWYVHVIDVLGFIYFATASYIVWYYFEKREYFRGLQGTCVIGAFVSVFKTAG